MQCLVLAGSDGDAFDVKVSASEQVCKRRESTPGLFSTRTEITLVFPVSISSHLSVVVNRSLEAQREQRPVLSL